MSPAVSRSARDARATRPRKSDAVVHTARKTRNGTAERRESSSSGSASAIAGPGTAECGWITYSQPLAARMTVNDTTEAVTSRAALSMREPPGSHQIGPCCHPAPERPVVASLQLEIGVMDSCRAEDRSELEVLQSQGVVGAGVEPEVRMGATQRSRSCADSVQRCVDRQPFELPPEDRMVLGSTLVAGPALDERELAWMLKRDVDR